MSQEGNQAVTRKLCYTSHDHVKSSVNRERLGEHVRSDLITTFPGGHSCRRLPGHFQTGLGEFTHVLRAGRQPDTTEITFGS